MDITEKDFGEDDLKLQPKVKDKAIEIANYLIKTKGYSKNKAIPIAVQQAKEWFLEMEG